MIFTGENFFARKALFIALLLMNAPAIAASEMPMAELLAKCAPTVAVSTMASIVKVESSGHVYAVADAGPVHLPWSVRKDMVRSHFPASKDEAVELVKSLLKKGHTVSIGLSQVNDRNLKALGLSVEDVFDPCTNVSAGGKILTNFYQRAAKEFGPGERALQAAISAYQSGNWDRGVANGYVGLVYKAAGVVPDLKIGTGSRALKVASADARTQSAKQWWESRAELLRKARESDLKAPKE